MVSGHQESKEKLSMSSIPLTNLSLLKLMKPPMKTSILLSKPPVKPLNRVPGPEWTPQTDKNAFTNLLILSKRMPKNWPPWKVLTTESQDILLLLLMSTLLTRPTDITVVGLTKLLDQLFPLMVHSLHTPPKNQWELLAKLSHGTSPWPCKRGS